jgi:hypothetical protein
MPKCLAKKHSGGVCQNNSIIGRNRCKYHGGMSLRGEQHWNYQGRGCSKNDRERAKELNADIKFLEMLATQLGMIPQKR